MGRRAYEYSRGMRWPEVGAEYAAIFARGSAGAHAAAPPGCQPRGHGG